MASMVPKLLFLFGLLVCSECMRQRQSIDTSRKVARALANATNVTSASVGKGPDATVNMHKPPIIQDSKASVEQEAALIQQSDEAKQQHVDTNSHEMSYEEAMAMKVNSMAWANLTTYRYDCRKRVRRFKWFGTAPFCGGRAMDCTNWGGRVDYYDSWGDGENCWSGEKVRCIRDDDYGFDDNCSPECSVDFEKFVIGTSPFCGASDCDCIRAGALPQKLVSDYRCGCQNQHQCAVGGKACMTGLKALCIKPKRYNAELQYLVGRADCTRRDEIDAEVKKAILNMVGEIAKAGAEAAAAGQR